MKTLLAAAALLLQICSGLSHAQTWFELLGNPERFDGKEILVNGIFCIQLEPQGVNCSLFFSREAKEDYRFDQRIGFDDSIRKFLEETVGKVREDWMLIDGALATVKATFHYNKEVPFTNSFTFVKIVKIDLASIRIGHSTLQRSEKNKSEPGDSKQSGK